MIAKREPRVGRKRMMPSALLVPWLCQNAFPQNASSPTVEKNRPAKGGIAQGRAENGFRCAAKMRGLKNANAEEDLFFIWGEL